MSQKLKEDRPSYYQADEGGATDGKDTFKEEFMN